MSDKIARAEARLEELAEMCFDAVSACFDARRMDKSDAMFLIRRHMLSASAILSPTPAEETGQRFIPINRSEMDSLAPCGHYLRFSLPCVHEDGSESMSCMQCDRDAAQIALVRAVTPPAAPTTLTESELSELAEWLEDANPTFRASVFAALRPPVAEGGRALCSRCEGNGVVKIHHGVSVCPRCKGDCWEPRPAPSEPQPATPPAAPTTPQCVGYPKCDGDLVATPHSPECPAYTEADAKRQAELDALDAEMSRPPTAPTTPLCPHGRPIICFDCRGDALALPAPPSERWSPAHGASFPSRPPAAEGERGDDIALLRRVVREGPILRVADAMDLSALADRLASSPSPTPSARLDEIAREVAGKIQAAAYWSNAEQERVEAIIRRALDTAREAQ